jgi:hypothetical protein
MQPGGGATKLMFSWSSCTSERADPARADTGLRGLTGLSAGWARTASSVRSGPGFVSRHHRAHPCPAGWTNQRYAGRQKEWVLASPTSAIAN